MRGKSFSTAIIALAMLAGGCWGDIKDIFPDGTWNPDGGDDDSGVATDPEAMIPGGGTAGEAISGWAHVYVTDEESGEPLEGAGVRAVTFDNSESLGQTGKDGLVSLDLDGAEGPIDLEIVAAGHVPQSVVRLRVSTITVPLLKSGPPTAVETVTISGAVTGLELLAEPDPDQERIAVVYYGFAMDRLLDFSEPGFDPGLSLGAEVRPDTGDETYEITVPASKGRLYVLAGLERNFGTPDTSDDIISWSHIGVVGTLDPEPGVLTDVDAPIEMATLVTAQVKIPMIPSSCNAKDAHLGLDFGAEGTIWLGRMSMVDVFYFRAPNYYGDYAEGEVVLVMEAGQSIEEGDEDPVADMPQSFKFERSLETYEGYETEAYEPEEMLSSSPTGLDFDGEKFTCFPVAESSFNQLKISSLDDGEVLWRVLVFGDVPLEGVAVPSVPTDWGFDGLPSEGVKATVWTLGGDIDTDECRFEELMGAVEDMAINEAVF